MAQPRLRRCANLSEMERVIDDMAVQGYKIKSRSETSALIEKPDFGTAGVHILLLVTTFWTFGLGNLIYAGVKWSGREQVALKVDSED